MPDIRALIENMLRDDADDEPLPLVRVIDIPTNRVEELFRRLDAIINSYTFPAVAKVKMWGVLLEFAPGCGLLQAEIKISNSLRPRIEIYSYINVVIPEQTIVVGPEHPQYEAVTGTLEEIARTERGKLSAAYRLRKILTDHCGLPADVPDLESVVALGATLLFPRTAEAREQFRIALDDSRSPVVN